ncbi:MAG: alpha/beta hydrolase [Pseudomonadota bacterium]
MSFKLHLKGAAMAALISGNALCLSLSALYAEDIAWDAGSYEPYPLPYFVDDIERYPSTTPAEGAVNRHGEVEYIGEGVFATHWFTEIGGAAWHYVTAGDPSNDVVLLLHGYPDTWYAYSHVMAKLSDEYYVVAPDSLGYGQSDKRAEIDVSYASSASGVSKLMDIIATDRFYLISHDRGSIISDHLIADVDMAARIDGFLRMQQSFDQPHGYPRPPHHLMAKPEFHAAENMIRNMYASDYASVDLPEAELARLEWEWGFAGTPEAAARTFEGTSFDIERAFRMETTIPNMTMPVLILQGVHDPGQHPEEYYRSANVIPNGRVVFVEANHFIHTEAPETVARLARNLFQKKNADRPELVNWEPVEFAFPVRDVNE